jgi:aspartyl protease family protein
MNRHPTPPRALRTALAAALLGAAAVCAQASTVSFSGMLGDKALLIIDGQARGVAVGSTVQGVKLVRLDGAVAQIELEGKAQVLHMGGGAVVGVDTSGGAGTRIVLQMGPGGHYLGKGAINGRTIPFIVDTGATFVSLSNEMAAELGIDTSQGKLARMSSANGTMMARRVTLASVTVGDVTVHNVEASVSPQPMPFVLLGNSFLSRFQMRSDDDTLTLLRKN